jgi:hypothetical protein
MAKEPAGLRRWRLAHRKKKHTRRYTVAKRRKSYRRYRGRKGRGRRSSKALPMLPAFAVAYPFFQSYKEKGLSVDMGTNLMYKFTGYHPEVSGWQPQIAAKTVGPIIVAVIGHKVAGKLGINRYVKKLSLGWLQL